MCFGAANVPAGERNGIMNDKEKKVYSKPEVQTIEIAAQEILGSGCTPDSGCDIS